MSDEQRVSQVADAPLLSLYEAFSAVPDPRSRHGQRYDLPYLLTCLVGALLCNCNSLEAVGQWCHDEHLRLASALWTARLLHADGFPLSSPAAPFECGSH